MVEWRHLIVLAALAACGCASTEREKAPVPPIDTPDSLTREPLGSALGTTPTPARWWTAFGSRPLDELVDMALAHSPTVDAMRATWRAAQENVVAQRGYFYPTAKLGYNVSRQGTGDTQSSALASGDTIYNYHTAQLSVGYVPDFFGANRRQVESLQATAQSQRQQLEGARLLLASNVVAAALQAASLVQQVQLTQEVIATASEQVQAMRKLQQNGYSSGLDVATQVNLLTQAQTSLAPLQKQLEQTRDLISVLAGQAPGAAVLELSLDALTLPPLPKIVPSEILARRPDVSAARSQLEAAAANIGVARTARLPQVSITAAFGAGATTFSQMFAAGNSVWSIGAGVLAPLFDGGTLAARQRVAEAQYDAAAAQYRAAALTAFQNVADSLYALDIDSRALQVADMASASAADVLRYTQSQLDQGYGSRPSMLAARQAWLQTRVAKVAAQGSMLGDSVALYQSAGGPLDASP